jgi:hypothetical protein
MQFDIDIRLFEYWQEQVKIRKKRWNNKKIKKFYWKQIVNRKLEKGGSVYSAKIIIITNFIEKLNIFYTELIF